MTRKAFPFPRIGVLAPIVVTFLVIALFFVMLRRDPTALPSVLVGRGLPAFSLESLAGPEPSAGAFTQAALVEAARQAEGPVLLNFFASWCLPCLAEHPLLERYSARADLPLFGIAWKDAPDQTRAWLDRHGWIYRQVGIDEDNRAGFELGLSGVPETFLITPDGQIRLHHAGPLTPRIWEEKFQPALEQLDREGRG